MSGKEFLLDDNGYNVPVGLSCCFSDKGCTFAIKRDNKISLQIKAGQGYWEDFKFRYHFVVKSLPEICRLNQ